MELSDYKDRIGTVLAFEVLGTSLLVTSFNVSAQSDVLNNAIMYFVAVIVTIQVSGAHLNPAITFAVWIKGAKYAQEGATMVLIWVAQFFGVLLGLEIGLMMRIVYNSGGGNFTAVPPFNNHAPPVAALLGNDVDWFTVLLVEFICTMIFVVFYLQIKATVNNKDLILQSFYLGVVYYAMMWLAAGTSSGILNPAVATGIYLSDTWNAKYLASGVWVAYYISWMIGPMLGGALAPFMAMQQEKMVDRFTTVVDKDKKDE